jgi:peptidyl-tRNA hydrolase, PTH1 family
MALLQFFQRLFRKGTPPEIPDVLFFGLGNPGGRYALTRHNTGYRVADALTEQLANRKDGRFGDSAYIQGTLFESRKKVLVVKPQTFMNRSGDTVGSYITCCHPRPQDILVIVDDYNLPLGRLRARLGGSDGGHNGLKSIIDRLGRQDFPRLRVGIGPLPQGVSSIDFVLGPFTGAEEKELDAVIARTVDACVLFAQNGIEAVMNKFN